MRDVPEIAPEVRGLLEEIVADPRSRIRLAPRRALSTWFDTGETARASEITRTKAEKHLVEVHREELAALLCEASWISYWKAPSGLAHRPLGADGDLFQPAHLEPDWASRARRESSQPAHNAEGIRLLHQCLLGIRSQQGLTLARASLSLVPSDKTRCYIALNVPWGNPKTAITFFRRLERRAQPESLRPDILLSLGSRTCSLGLFSEARQYYRTSIAIRPQSPYGRMCAFNLSCFLGEAGAAKNEADGLRFIGPDDPRLQEERAILREWMKAQSPSQLEEARKACEQIKGEIPESAEVLRQAIIT